MDGAQNTEHLERAILVGMIHDAAIKNGAACALDPILFKNPDYRKTFIALSGDSFLLPYDAMLLRQLQSRHNLPDISSLLTEQPLEKDKLRSYIEAIKAQGGRGLLKDLLKSALEKTDSSSIEALQTARETRDDLDSIIRAIVPWEEFHPPIKDLVHGAIGKIEETVTGNKSGINSGYFDLDKLLKGFRPGIYVFSARPYIDMTDFALGIALNLAIDQKRSVFYNTLSKTPEELVQRMLHARSRVNKKNTIDGFLAERDYPKLTIAAGKIATSKMRIQRASTADHFYNECCRLKQREGLGLAIVDRFQNYLQGPTNHQDMAVKEFALGEQFYQIAKDLAIPILLLSEMSGERDKRVKAVKPVVGEIRNHAAFEYSANAIMLAYSNRESEEEYSDPDVTPVNVIVATNDNGPTGDIPLSYFKNYGLFESAAKVSAEEV